MAAATARGTSDAFIVPLPCAADQSGATPRIATYSLAIVPAPRSNYDSAPCLTTGFLHANVRCGRVPGSDGTPDALSESSRGTSARPAGNPFRNSCIQGGQSPWPVRRARWTLAFSGGYVRRLDQGSITSRDVMGSFKQFFSECLADRSPSARAMIANVPQSS